MDIEKLLQEKKRHDLPEIITPQEKALLEKGVPIQKIMGFIDFDNLKININHNVLIPRYETQEVVNFALKHINAESKVLDLCTGSGYIGLTIKQATNAYVVMSDISDDSILQSNENAKFNNLDVKIIKSNMFENINEKFDVIISNPPYIPNDNKLASSVFEFEPTNALLGGVDGNDFYRIIIEQASTYIKDNGWLILEISNDNVPFLKKHSFSILKDINGKDRIAFKQIK